MVKPRQGSGSRGVRYNQPFNKARAASYIQTFGPTLVQERISPEGDAIGVSVFI